MPFTISGEWTPDPIPSSHSSTLPVKVTKEKRRGAFVTLVLNIPSQTFDLKELCSFFRKKHGCGGTIKNQVIELQGDLVEIVSTHLKSLGIKVATQSKK